MKFGQLKIDPVALGSQGNAVLGIRDSGKTYTATLLAESLFDAGIPFIAFDPVGVWRFLRVPGKGHGYKVVVAGGEDGDLALTPASAPKIVEAAMQQGVSLVIDLFSMELSKADWRRIVRDCVTLLLHRNKVHGLRHVFLEEAAEFVPQRVFDGEVYAAVEKLARMGGNSRLGYTLINQRAEEVNKAVLELCDNLFLHRQKGKNSLLSLQKWLDVGDVSAAKEIVGTLSTLPTGECWAWLAGSAKPVLVKVPAKNSLHPDRRVMRGDAGTIQQKAVDVGGFVDQLKSALPEIEALAKENDPKALRAQIAALKKQMGQNNNLPKVDYKLAAADEVRLRSEGYNAGWAAALKETKKAHAVTVKGFDDARDVLNRIASLVHAASSRVPVAPADPAPIKTSQFGNSAVAAPTYRADQAKSNAKMRRAVDGVGRPQQKVLDALAWWLVAGKNAPSRAMVAGVAGYSPSSGGFNNLIGGLNTAGLVHIPAPGQLGITDAGSAIADNSAVPDTGVLHDRIKGILKAPQWKVLAAAIDAYPEPLTREALGEASGYSASSGGFNNLVGSLGTLEMLDKPAPGQVRAADWLFV